MTVAIVAFDPATTDGPNGAVVNERVHLINTLLQRRVSKRMRLLPVCHRSDNVMNSMN